MSESDIAAAADCQEFAGRHPSTTGWLKWFCCDHLTGYPAEVAQAVRDLAVTMVRALPDSQQLAVGLGDLLRAKDAFVRAAVDVSRNGEGAGDHAGTRASG